MNYIIHVIGEAVCETTGDYADNDLSSASQTDYQAKKGQKGRKKRVGGERGKKTWQCGYRFHLDPAILIDLYDPAVRFQQ